MMEGTESISDENNSQFSCDLGLGQGLKPGGLPKHSPASPRKSYSLPNSPEKQSPLTPDASPTDDKEDFHGLFGDLGHWTLGSLFGKFSPSLRGKSKELLLNSLNECAGGSIQGSCKKCQKSSVYKKIRTRRNSDSALNEKNTVHKSPLKRSKSTRVKPWNYFQDQGYKSLQTKLQKAKEEIDTLNCDLENCQEELKHKYGAMKNMHMYSRLERARSTEVTRKALEASKRLEQEVNMLQWELELKQSYLLDSEQTWMERFDRVATENAALLVGLHTRSDELRKLALDKIALIRERDELTAALEVRDRIRDDACTPEEDGPFSSEELIIELATLGACQCRGHNQEPCGCARAAVDSKREFRKLNKQLELSRHQEEEALLTADAYRVAFEQQLTRNSSLIHELLHKSVQLPWKRKLKLNGGRKKGDDAKDKNSQWSTEEDFLQLMRSRNDELVQRLVDMLSDKSEALAHQKMATKLLASKIREQEKVIQQYKAKELLIIPSDNVEEYSEYEPELPITV